MPTLNFTKRQWMTLFVIGLADFCNAICVSLQAPFFPSEAERKGCTATEYGLVFGVFELVVFLVSPLYGQYINRIGPKILFNGGIFTTGISAIFFGLLDRIPGHTPFITLAFIIRIIEALGNAAFLTASFAIIAKEFPNNVGTTFASLETFFGLGLIVGPVVGGSLYAFGGYFLPFVVLGSVLFSTALITLCILPKHSSESDNTDVGPSMKSVLSIPGVLVCSFGICATSASIGFLGATLEPHLRQFALSPILLGMIFVINGGVYALTAPIWGWMVDRWIYPKVAALVGSVLVSIAFCIIGPASFIPLETKLNNVILGLVLHGVGISSLLVASFTDALRTSVRRGLPDNIETYGLISGLWTSTFALGAFVGPSVSGALYDSVGFRGATNFIIALHTLLGLTLFIFMCYDRSPGLYKEVSQEEPLLRKIIGISNNENEIKNGYKNGQSQSIINHACIDRGCNFHNLMTEKCSRKENKWTSLCENNSIPANTRHYYGSVDGIRNCASTYQETIA